MGVDLDRAKAETQAVYERHAQGWDRHRPRKLFERPWLERFSSRIAAGGSILDLGCGAGDPISKYFIEHGYWLTGIDYARSMLDIARTRYPQAVWLEQDMRALDLPQGFDGVISWDGFFHLSIAEQRRLIPSFADLVNTGGALLLTVGPDEGEVTGTVQGETVYHASLSPAEYRSLLADNGFHQIDFVAEDPGCDGHSVLLASRAGMVESG